MLVGLQRFQQPASVEHVPGGVHLVVYRVDTIDFESVAADSVRVVEVVQIRNDAARAKDKNNFLRILGVTAAEHGAPLLLYADGLCTLAAPEATRVVRLKFAPAI